MKSLYELMGGACAMRFLLHQRRKYIVTAYMDYEGHTEKIQKSSVHGVSYD